MAGLRGILPTGQSSYAFLINTATELYWNGSALESFAAGNVSTYKVAVAEEGTTGIYVAPTPTALPAGTYDVIFYLVDAINGDRAAATQSLINNGTGTADGTIPLGSLTGPQMLAYVRRSGFLRDDMDAEAYDAITDTVLEMEQLFDFDERQIDTPSSSTITALGGYKLPVEQDQGFLITVRVNYNNYSQALQKISKACYDYLYPAPSSQQYRGFPGFYAVFGGNILLGAPPDNVLYTYQVAYSKILTAVIDGVTNPVPFSSRYREVLKDGTMMRLFYNLKDIPTAQAWQAKYEAGYDRIHKFEMRTRGGAGQLAYNDF